MERLRHATSGRIKYWNTVGSNPPVLQLLARYQGVTKRCRLSWLTNSALVYEPKMQGEGGVVQLNTGAQINFGDLHNSTHTPVHTDARVGGGVGHVSRRRQVNETFSISPYLNHRAVCPPPGVNHTLLKRANLKCPVQRRPSLFHPQRSDGRKK